MRGGGLQVYRNRASWNGVDTAPENRINSFTGMRPSFANRLVFRIDSFLEAQAVRVALAALVVLSVLPAEFPRRIPMAIFAGVFAAECVMRGFVLVSTRRRRTRADWLFFAVDLVALASFAPWLLESMGRGGAVLASARLVRLLFLLRFLREPIGTSVRVLARRELVSQFALVTLAVTSISLVTSAMLTTLEIPADYDANPDTNDGFLDRFWWAFRQLESPDNLVPSARTHPFLLLVSLTLTILGVFLISYIIGIGANVVDQVVRAERRRPLPWTRHTLILGPAGDAETLVREFLRIHDKNRHAWRVRFGEVVRYLRGEGPRPQRHAFPRIAMMGDAEDPPAYLYDPEARRVLYRQGDATDPSDLGRVAIHAVRRAVILGDSQGSSTDADARALARLSAFRARNRTAHVFVEMHRDDHHDVARAVGGDGTHVLDVPRFLGYFLAHEIVVPGSSEIFRELLSAEGSEIYTHILVDPLEQEALGQTAGESGRLDLRACARHAADRGLALLGVFLAADPARTNERGLVDTENLVVVWNPFGDLPPEARALGAEPGCAPAGVLRGFIGVSETYVHFRDFARDVVFGRIPVGVDASNPHGSEVATDAAPRLAGTDGAEVGQGAPKTEEAERPPTTEAATVARVVEAASALPVARESHAVERILVVGYSHALPVLLQSVGRRAPESQLHVVLAVPPGDGELLRSRLESLGHGLGLSSGPVVPGTPVRLATGGTVLVQAYEGPDRSGFAARCAAGLELDAAVFLSDPEAPDRDARTVLQVLKFCRALDRRSVCHGKPFRLFVEIRELHRGAGLDRHVRACAPALRGAQVTLVATDLVKNYFMVQGAFVPGVLRLYEALLGGHGQDLVRYVPHAAAPMPSTYGELRARLEAAGVLVVALEHADGEVEVVPPIDRRLSASTLRAVFGIAATAAEPDAGPGTSRTA